MKATCRLDDLHNALEMGTIEMKWQLAQEITSGNAMARDDSWIAGFRVVGNLV